MHCLQYGECSSYPIKCSLIVEGIELPMTVDTGAEVSLIAEDSRMKVLPDVPLRDTNIVLRIFVIFFSHSFSFLFFLLVLPFLLL